MTGSRIINKLKSLNPWHFLWITVALSEIFTLAANSIQSYVWWGSISRDLLLIGSIDAFFVSAVVAPIVMYFLKRTEEIERTNERLLEEIEGRRRAEEELEKEKSFTEHALDTLKEIFFVFDFEGRFLRWNEALKEISGYSDEEIASMKPADFFPEGEAPKVMRAIKAAIKEGYSFLEANFLTRDRRLIPYYLTGSLLKDSDGKTVGICGVGTDITERRRMEALLQESEAKFKDMAERSMVGIYLIQDEIFRYVNPTLAEIFGYKVKEIIDKKGPEDLVLPEDWPTVRGNLRKRISGEMTSTHYSFKGIKKNRETIHVEVYGSKTTYKANPAVIGTLLDVTERTRAEEELRRSETKYKNLFDSTLDGIYQVNAAGVFILMNPAGARIFGYDNPQEIIGKNALEHWRDPRDRDGFRAELKVRKTVSSYHMRAKKKTGEPIELESSSRIIEDEKGNFIGIEGILRDVTDRKKAEERASRQMLKLSSLRSIDLAISSSLDLRVTLRVFLEHVVSQLRVDAANVLLLNPHNRTLEYAAGQGFRTDALKHSRLRLGEGFAGVAALENRIVRIPNLNEEGNGFNRARFLKGEDFITYYGVPLVAKGHVKGVLEIFHRAPLEPDEEWFEFLDGLALQAAIAIDNNSLFYELDRSNMRLMQAYDRTIEGWSRALDYRDKETEGHSQRVTAMTVRIADEMGIGEEELVHVRRGALLHDIGKMGIPDSVLLKPGPLTDDEWKIMRLHPVYSYDLLYPIAYLRPALDIPYCHHEKWDGSGYPRGLRGEQIPLSARIFSVVDVWDALRSDRPYRPAWSEEKTKEYIRSMSGIQFDPEVVETFIRAMTEEKMNVR